MHAYQIWNFHFEDYSDYYSAIRLFWVNIVKSYTTKITYLFWNSPQRASNEELSCEPKQSIKQIVDLPVIWMLCHSQDIALMGRLLHNLNLVPGRRTVTDWVGYEAQPEFIGLCSGSAGASVVAHGVALPLYRDCFLDLRLFNSPDLRRLVLCYCCQAWTLETVLGGNTALPRWWTARSIDADAKR